MTEIKIAPSINGMVEVVLDPVETIQPASDVYERALDMIEAVYQAGAIREIDAVMHKHRARYMPEVLEWRLLDAVWGDLRKALGLGPEFGPPLDAQRITTTDEEK